MLRIDDNGIELIGSRPMRIFKKGIETYEVQPGDNIEFLLNRQK
jgi:dipeptidase E